MASTKRFGERLKEWRARRRMTQETLGEKIGSDGPRVHRLEKGAENPTLETLDKVADALEIDVSQLLQPRPEEAGHERTVQGNPWIEKLLASVDTDFPAEESWKGDIHKAIAALNRALRREGTTSSTARTSQKP